MLNPKIYNTKYLISQRCEGYFEDLEGKLSPIKEIEVRLLDISKKDIFLDVGCGRGEVLDFLSFKSKCVYGVDYSADAVRLTKNRLSAKFKNNVIKSDARYINLKDGTVTRILMGDIVEHMTFDEAVEMVNEAYRLLKPKGKLIIHTSPNKYFSKYLHKYIYYFLAVTGYKNVANKFKTNIDATRIYHVFEFTPNDLKLLMKKSRFKNYNIWINPDALRISSRNYLTPLKNNLFFRFISKLVNKTFLLNILGNDLFVSAIK
jgi:ubiquinone/menaquinone biosynthesis C-methylase UbiE